VISNRIKLLVVGIAMIGAASYAYACGDEKKESNSQASVASAEKACCAKGASAALASSSKDACVGKSASARLASKDCSAKSSSTASFASTAGGDHCAAGSKAKSATLAGLTYGEKSVTLAGACPAKNEADYSFYVSGAECRGTGASVAHAVKSVKGVSSVTVDYENHMVYVCADGKAASKKAIEKSLKTAGYDEVKFVNASKQNCQKSHGKIEA
jgi:copper chaperone CopZ